jgi:hypothetical protein
MYSPVPDESDGFGASAVVRAPISGVAGDSHARASQLVRTGWTIAAIAWLAYAAYFAQLTSFPFQDYSNHITRAAILADLLFHAGQQYGNAFEFHFALAPYLMHDVLLTALVAVFGVFGGAAVFTTAVFISLPCALLFYMRVNAIAPRARLFIVIVSLYLATDWFFLMGFMAFRLALAGIVVSIALLDSLRRHWSRPMFYAYIAVLVFGYLTHLTALVFFAPVLAVSGALRLYWRRTTLARELLLWAPVLGLLLIHFRFVAVAHDSAHPSAYLYYWSTIHDKIRRLNWEFERFDGRPSPLMRYTLILGVVWAVRAHIRWRAFLRPEVLEPLALAATFLVLYIVLPSAYADSTFVDVRALCMVALFLLLAALYLPPRAELGRDFQTPAVLGIALLLAVVNFAYLVLHLAKNDAWGNRYREVVAAIPPRARVLPIYTAPAQMDIEPFRHIGSFVTLDRGALIPYLFSGDRGDLMKYFTYRARPYMPDESWYKSREYWNAATEATYEVQGRRYTWRFRYARAEHQWEMSTLVPVDWNRVACEYDFLLPIVPYREDFIEIPTKPVAYNETAALLAVDKQACHPGAARPHAVRLPQER